MGLEFYLAVESHQSDPEKMFKNYFSKKAERRKDCKKIPTHFLPMNREETLSFYIIISTILSIDLSIVF